MEENIRPNNPNDMDRVLFYHVRPIVHFLKLKRWLLTWHFLRESENWRGNQRPLIPHIRFRVRAESETNLNQLRNWLTTVIDGLQHAGMIADHYWGNHGNPAQDYQGESANFDEGGTRLPQGWDAVQRLLQAGSEIKLIFLRSVFRQSPLAPRFILPDILHFFANQCNRGHDWTMSGQFMIIEM